MHLSYHTAHFALKVVHSLDISLLGVGIASLGVPLGKMDDASVSGATTFADAVAYDFDQHVGHRLT